MRPSQWLAIAFGVVLTSCDMGPSNSDTEMYVRVPPQDAQKFMATLASILGDEGVSASVGRTAESPPATNHILEAKSLNVRVWAQNVVLDPEEGKACGYPFLNPVEQTQYVVSVQRRSPLSEDRARQMFAKLRTKLVERGYTITARQMSCQPLSKVPLP